MRRFFYLALLLLAALLGAASARAFDVVVAPENVNAINLRTAVDIIAGVDGKIQISTAAGEDGIIRRIEVPASQAGTNPGWAIFALRNDADVQIDRLLVAPFFRLPGSGVLRPDLGAPRISVLTPSAGIRPVRIPDREADIFEITLDPGATVTMAAELTSGSLPELYLWTPDAYRDYVNSFTLFRGVVLGIAVLAAVFLTIMFAVKRRGIFPATAVFAWAVLAYLLVDFGIVAPLLGLANSSAQPLRAAAEAGVATTLFAFLFIYLNLHRWHLRFLTLAAVLTLIFLALFGFAFFLPVLAVTVTRLVLVAVAIAGCALIVLFALRGYDRAVLLVPTWIIYVAWLYYGWLVVAGHVTNDVAQPAIAGGLVLIVMLLAFTSVQHAFSEGQISIGTLSEVERRALALTGSGAIVFDWNLERDRVVVSDELAVRLGEPRGALRGSIERWLERVRDDDREKLHAALDTLVEMRRGRVSTDIRLIARDGNYRTFRLRVKPVLAGDNQVCRIVGTLQDVTEERAARARLLHDAVFDSLTGLPNKELFLDRLELLLARARLPDGTKPAVLLIDIDNFVATEERIGTSAADSLLLGISRRIARIMRPLDTVARLAGDQFGVILASEGAPGAAIDIAEQVRKALKVPFNFGDRDITLTASIGVASPDAAVGAEHVLHEAELAMYYAKRLGRDRVEGFRPAARVTTYARTSEGDIDRGLRQGEFEIHYQPIVDIHNNEIAGAEALLRWKHPLRGLLLPEEFVPLAERSGLIDRLGRTALEQAAAQTGAWLKQFALRRDFFVSINLSPAQLRAKSLLDDVGAALAGAQHVAAHLKFEITESQVMGNPEHAAHILAALREMGFRLALDDFGTGHSSLSYLHRLPIDTIKIPAPFVRLFDDGDLLPTQAPIIRALVSLASELDLLIIAEGVESEEEIERLRNLNCHLAQGFAYGAATSAADFGKLLATRLGR